MGALLARGIQWDRCSWGLCWASHVPQRAEEAELEWPKGGGRGGGWRRQVVAGRMQEVAWPSGTWSYPPSPDFRERIFSLQEEGSPAPAGPRPLRIPRLLGLGFSALSILSPGPSLTSSPTHHPLDASSVPTGARGRFEEKARPLP